MADLTLIVRCNDVEKRGKDIFCYELSSQDLDENQRVEGSDRDVAVMLRMSGQRDDMVKFNGVYRLTLERIPEAKVS